MSKTLYISQRVIVSYRTNSGNSKWKWPEVDGLQNFQGTLIHTAAWPKDFDYANKTVAVIGNGASGVQLLPAIQPGKPHKPRHEHRSCESDQHTQASRKSTISSAHQHGSHHHGAKPHFSLEEARC